MVPLGSNTPWKNAKAKAAACCHKEEARSHFTWVKKALFQTICLSVNGFLNEFCSRFQYIFYVLTVEKHV